MHLSADQHHALKFWRDFELFLPKNLVEPDKLNKPKWQKKTLPDEQTRRWPQGQRDHYLRLPKHGGETEPLPWSVQGRLQENLDDPDPLVDHPWRSHRVYIGLVDASAVGQALLEKVPLKSMEVAKNTSAAEAAREQANLNFEEKWRATGRYALISLDLDAEGCLAGVHKITLSSLLMGLERLATSNTFPKGGFNLQSNSLAERQAILSRYQGLAKDVNKTAVDWPFLQNEIRRLQDRLMTLSGRTSGAFWIPEILVVSQDDPANNPKAKIKPDASEEEQTEERWLDSIGFTTLNELAYRLDPMHGSHEFGTPETPSKPLLAYLGPPTHASERQDWLEDGARFSQAFAPDRIPAGCWPADYPLFAAQLAAVGEVTASLEQGGLSAINGPPGSGKTTLLKDIMAHVVIERAKKLASVTNPMDWLQKYPDGGQSCCLLKPELVAKSLIVVASSNNNAVENISKELPRRSKIERKKAKSDTPGEGNLFNYLKPIGDAWKEYFGGQEIWGPFAMALGNSKNRKKALKMLANGKPKKGNSLKQINEDSSQWCPPDWNAAREDFLKTLGRVETLRDQVNTQHQAIQNVEKLREETKMGGPIEARLNQELGILAARHDQEAAERADTVLVSKQKLDLDKTTVERAKHSQRLAHKTWERIAADRPLSMVERLMFHLIGYETARCKEYHHNLKKASEELTRAEEYYRLNQDLWRKQEQDHKILEAHMLDPGHDQRAKREERMLEVKIKNHIQHQTDLFGRIERMEGTISDASRREYEFWAKPIKSEPKRHAIGPWAFHKDKDRPRGNGPNQPTSDSDQWMEARQDLFQKAMALHEAALGQWMGWSPQGHAAPGNPANKRGRLGRALRFHLTDLLNANRKVPANLVGPLWDLVGFICPVVSTTLTSASNQFAGIPASSIGWLLVDEAGQATSGSLAWALQKSHRAVVVGDPQQLEPVVSMPPSIIDRLQAAHDVPDRFRPDTHSAQSLADMSMKQGAWIPVSDGGADGKIWTGLPLRAHRRCQSPMFDIANEIAYSNQMVQANTLNKIVCGQHPQDSFWWDIPSKTVLYAQVIQEELDALKLFLEKWKVTWPVVRNAADDPAKDECPELATLFVLAPFKRVARDCQAVVEELNLEKSWVEVGTLHTFQGREADTVVLVLGTADHADGARNWASNTPNLLNVAVTRAKYQIIVIGSYENWSGRNYFNVLAKALPARKELYARPDVAKIDG